jgi:hypothetical protein
VNYLTPDSNDEMASWLESRRLIISQLSAMDASIRELGTRIDRFNEMSRDRALELSKEAQSGIAELRMRVAMLELRAKLWGATLGMISGGIATGLTQLILQSLRH